MTDMEQARSCLEAEHLTCVLCRDGVSYRSRERGVRPLVRWLECGEALQGYAAADRVVGRAAAYLYVLLGVRALYAEVLAQGASVILAQAGIETQAGQVVPAIQNRAGTGICPMEEAVRECRTPQEAYAAIARRLKELEKGKPI